LAECESRPAELLATNNIVLLSGKKYSSIKKNYSLIQKIYSLNNDLSNFFLDQESSV